MRELWKHFEDINDSLNIDECGIEKFYPGQQYFYTVPQNFVIHIIQEGSGTFEVEGKKYALEKGQGFIVKKSQTVEYTADEDSPWRNYWVGLSGKHLNRMLENSSLVNQHILNFPPNSQTAKLIYEFCSQIKINTQTSPDELWFTYKAYELLYHFNEEFNSNTIINDVQLNKQDYASIAKDYILSNYSRDMTIEEVANFIGLSRSHLYRVFKKKYHQAPQQYLQAIRMNQAKILLEDTELPIKEIAFRVGYNDQMFFSKTFKNKQGCSPTGYREQQQT